MKAVSTLAALAAVFFAGAASANESEVVELPFGNIDIIRDAPNFAAVVTDGSTEIRLDSAYLPDVVETYDNSVLIFMATGGNACAGHFSWVTLDENGLSATAPFGTCAGRGGDQDNRGRSYACSFSWRR